MQRGVTVAGTPFALTPAANLALLRVGQEALVNVRKHARGRSASVRLAYTDSAVELTISTSWPRRRACACLGTLTLGAVAAGPCP